MAKRVMIWGAPVVVDKNLSPLKAFEASGNNFGNTLIGSAVYSMLSNNKIISRWDLGSPAEADERCDHVVIPAANFLWKDFDFGYMYDFLEKTSLPVTIIGVGAQTNDRATTSPVHPNTLRLMRLISERSDSLGVRGFYTAEVLAANGIHNVSVIGCPSLYSTKLPAIRVKAENLTSPTALSVNFSRRVNRHAFSADRMRAIENVLLKIALKHDADFVAQDEIDELQLSAGIDVNVSPISKYFDQSDSSVVVDYFKRKTQYFCDVESWATYIRRKTLSVGSRFHGNLIALINGVPALMIVHDSRTLEMCALMGMPSVNLNQLDDKLYTEDGLWEVITNCSFTQFERSYAELYKRFVGFLDANQLVHTLPQPEKKMQS